MGGGMLVIPRTRWRYGAPLIAAVAVALMPSDMQAQERPLGTLREQATVQQEWLRLRLEGVLPRLMRAAMR